MPSRHIKNRIKRIQRHLNAAADGIIGPETLTKIEKAIGLSDDNFNLKVSLKGLKKILQFEVGSKANYTRNLTSPSWPGGRSGATIGIGYDLGYQSKKNIEKDWKGLVSDATLEKLIGASGKKGKKAAKKEVTRLKRAHVVIPIQAAEEVFYNRTLPKYAKMTRKAYPGIEGLPPDAQAMLLSLVYNRGAKINGARRKEMKAIKSLIAKKDLSGIAKQFIAMKRLWVNKGLVGLLKRRDAEAKLIKKAKHRYADEDIVLL